MTRTRVTRRTLIRECPTWSTMQWISATAMTRIDTEAKRLGRARHASRRDVVGLMAMYCVPENPQMLWNLVEPYLQDNKREAAKGKGGQQALMVKLPSPVSLRIDALVALASEIGTIYRQDLIGALAMNILPRDDRLIDLFDRYHGASAADAEVSGAKLSVFSTEPPNPGRRPISKR